MSPSSCPITMSQQIANSTLDELLSNVQKAIAAPALANAALLSAKGSPTTYVTMLNELYVSNDLPLPDFSTYLTQHGDSTIQTPSSKYVSCDTVDFFSVQQELNDL